MVDVEILFGVDADADHIFDDLDVDKNGKVSNWSSINMKFFSANQMQQNAEYHAA